nr:sigma-70 family RNA polymerase sigma factor [Bacteroides sp. 519]
MLYDKFSSNLYGFVFGLVKSETMAKEIVHETFIKVWINRENINPDLSFKSYLFKISKNRIIDLYREQLSNPVMEDYLDYCDSIQLSENNIISKIDYDAFVERLELAKNKLTTRQREIFEMSKEQGISSKEIAQQLNISEQTTYNILSTAVRIVKEEIGVVGLLLFSIFFE